MIELDVLNKKKLILPKSFNIGRTKPVKSVVYDTYWKFATERQSIFFKRASNQESNWTSDPILQKYKFTNAYRASDRVSQYLIRNVIYNGVQNPEEQFFRILFFKIFNKIETWEYLESSLGEITFNGYNFELYINELNKLKSRKISIYSPAYIMASGKSSYGFDSKHENHLKMLEQMMSDKLYDKLGDIRSMNEVYNELITYPTIGKFLAYQFATDLNYSEMINFSEMEFVKAGPGAIDGIQKCFKSLGDYSPEDIIRMMAENQEDEFERLGLNFKNLWGRKLQLVDCQNLFCEVDKYSRIAHPNVTGLSGRTRIKQKYKRSNLNPIDLFYPPKWGINQNINSCYGV